MSVGSSAVAFEAPGGSASPMLLIEELANDSAIVIASAALREVRARAELVASVNVPILLVGETGTGKDVVARLIHKLSPRSHRTFFKVNCAAVPGELLESELFGYEAGAFTGAVHSKPGQFQLCDEGTLYLDEIGEMPPSLQAKLLHVLQDKRFCRLGGRETVNVDVRIVAATNVDVASALREGNLREDLYYRLSAFTLSLPPLRDRREEIPALFKHFVERFAAQYSRSPRPPHPALMEACLAHPWPGNVRELENFVRRYVILGDTAAALADLGAVKPISTAHPAAETASAAESGPGLKSRVRNIRKGLEVEAIKEALEKTHWNRTRAAALLNISSRTLRYKMVAYGIRPAKVFAGAGRLSEAQKV